MGIEWVGPPCGPKPFLKDCLLVLTTADGSYGLCSLPPMLARLLLCFGRAGAEDRALLLCSERCHFFCPVVLRRGSDLLGSSTHERREANAGMALILEAALKSKARACWLMTRRSVKGTKWSSHLLGSPNRERYESPWISTGPDIVPILPPSSREEMGPCCGPPDSIE